MAWRLGQPLPGSLIEAAQKIERLLRMREAQSAQAGPISMPDSPAGAYLTSAGGRFSSASAPASSAPAEAADPGSQEAPVDILDLRGPARSERIGPTIDFSYPWLAGVGSKYAPTTQPVNAGEWLVKLGFDLSGPSEWRAPNAFEGAISSVLANLATRSRFPTERRENDAADAFRHALWAFRMARWIGPDAARVLHDSHEISSPNATGGRLMDVFNSRVGARLALDPRNRDRSAAEVIAEALRSGMLQTQPFRLQVPALAGAR
jgi:hypothetical protein